MSFNAGQVASVEFGVCRGSLRDGESTLVPVEQSVQALLREMVQDSFSALGLADGVALDPYEPSQDHGATSKLALALDSPLAGVLSAFYGVENRPIDAGAMDEPSGITAYFCIMHDRDGNKLVAIRRSAQFKAMLEARLIQLIDDSFRAVDDQVFKLDRDFDIVIVDGGVLINRVVAFESLAEIDEAVQAAAVENARQLEQTLPFVGFAGISEYVEEHKRTVRVVAALCARDDLPSTSVANLRRECKRSGVQFRMEEGKIVPEAGHELAFLQMLDRRRYALSLIPGTWEQYEAGSRKAAGVRVDQAAKQVPRARPRARAGRRKA